MQLTGLTSLSLVSKNRSPPNPAPEALSHLTALRQLKLSHGLTQASQQAGRVVHSVRRAAWRPRGAAG